MARVSCLGPQGSYSELAARSFLSAETGETVLCRNFSEVVSALLSGKTDFAVLPIENSIRGGVLQNLDLLGQSAVFAVRELVLPIDHRLAVRTGVTYDKIKRVYSHEQAIGQCAEFLQNRLSGAQCVFTSSTAESLSLLDGESAGIVGAHVSAAGVELSKENIADEKHNFTRFLLLGKENKSEERHSRKIFFCAVCKHEPGSLVQLLKIFADCGHNLTRIESRPIKDVFGEYRFFIEFEGDFAEPEVREMLKQAESLCQQFRVLGAYD